MIGANLLEVKIEHEVELTLEDVAAIHERLEVLSGGKPVAALVQKTNHYSYSFEAMRSILLHPLLFALAYTIASDAQRPAIGALLSVSASQRRYPIEVFTSRREALEWLQNHGADVELPSRK